MPGKWRKKKKTKTTTTLPESSGATQVTAKLDHVLVAENKQAPFLKHNKRGLAILAGVVLLVAAGGGYAWYARRENPVDKQNRDFQTLMSSVKDLRDQGNDDGAGTQLTGFNDKYPNQTQEQRYRIASELAVIFKTKGDYKSALEWQQKAFDNNPNPKYRDYYELGEAYTMNGNKDQAIRYLELALEALKKGGEPEIQEGDHGPRGNFIRYQLEVLKGNPPTIP